MRMFKKYGNRKMYDEEKGCYISMLGLSDVVAEGERVSVTCDRTGADCTLEALTRALYERLKMRKPSLALPFQATLIERLIRKIDVAKS